MESRDHSKNAASLKSLMSKRNKIKIINYFIVLVSIFSLLTFTSCDDKDSPIQEPELPEIDENGLTKDITDVVPIEIINEMKELGMPIYGGNTPPLLTLFMEDIEDELRSTKNISDDNYFPLSSQSLITTTQAKAKNSEIVNLRNSLKSSVQGPSLVFDVSPIILLRGNNEGDSPGNRFVDSRITLKNQDNKKLTIDYYENEGGGLALTEGAVSYIVGNDCQFTIFNIINHTQQSGSIAKITIVISGTITPDGIENFHKTLSMLEDYGDPNGDLMEVGKVRVFHDSDGFSPRYGINERTWDSNLPPCPCTLKEVEQLIANNTNIIGCFNGRWTICPGTANQTYHYGATTEVRWSPSDDWYNPGQQCTYDKNGKLITGGLAAGSPDKVSPQGCGWNFNTTDVAGHWWNDVRTYNNLPAVNYLRDWPANNILACEENIISGIGHMLKLVGQMTATEIVEIIKNANESKYNIPADLRKYILREKVSLTDAQILGYLKTWEKNVDDATGLIDSKLEDSLDKAIINMQK
jgi:hypothetical protein